jgi:hypothetical protein
MERAEVTAFLSLIFILLVTFIGGIMESASVQMAKNYRRADVNRAMESVFAEYQKELLEHYDIFSLDGTYESGKYSESLVERRLGYFGADHMENTIQRIQFLTDNGAEAFYEQVMHYMENKYGLNHLKDKFSMTDTWKAQEEKADRYEKESHEKEDELNGLLGEAGGELPSQDNPIAHVSQLKKKSLLDLIMPGGRTVSGKKINLDNSLLKRKKNKGYGNFSDVADGSSPWSSLVLGEYLLGHFSMATDEETKGALDYELEYICAGKASDRENLEAVAKRLILIRFASNYLFLQNSPSKQAEAEALALTLCTLAALPALCQAAAQVILLAWAFGESVVDLRALLNGSRVPFTKTEANWQLSLAGLMKLGESGDISDGKDSKEGLYYKEYLRILLFLEKKEKIGMRALDMIEQNLQKVYGAEFFKADCCISRVEIKSSVKLRRGITYQFQTYYGYN